MCFYLKNAKKIAFLAFESFNVNALITLETRINCLMHKKIITHHESCIYLISWKEKLEKDTHLI